MNEGIHPLRIAFWHYYTFGMHRGIETLTLSLANALARRDVEVSLVTASPTVQPLVVPDPEVRVFAFPTTRYFSHLSIVPYYLDHFARHRYDYIVVFFADFGEAPTWRLLRRMVDLPLVLYLCYPYSAVPHRYDSFLKLGWHRTARHVLADASWVAAEASELFQRTVPVLPVGTDAERFSPNAERRGLWRRRFGLDNDDVVLLSVSALEPRKCVFRIIDAVWRLKECHPNLRYLVLGRGEEEGRLRALVRDRGLDEKVIFGGTTAELEAYYSLADVFVMLPDDEANSVACQEAMSCGLPVVASESGGFVESVPPAAGFLVDPTSATAIDNALSRLILDAELRVSMGQVGREHIVANCTWDRVANQMLEMLAPRQDRRLTSRSTGWSVFSL